MHLTDEDHRIPLDAGNPPRAASLLRNPQRWCQYAGARDAAGNKSFPSNSASQSWDVVGAIDLCYNQRDDRLDCRFRLAFYLRRQGVAHAQSVGTLDSCTRAINAWQDDSSTTHHEVVETLAYLDI